MNANAVDSEEESCLAYLHSDSDPRSTQQSHALCQQRAGLEHADHIADTSHIAPDDQHCQVVFVVDYDQVPEASASLGCQMTSAVPWCREKTSGRRCCGERTCPGERREVFAVPLSEGLMGPGSRQTPKRMRLEVRKPGPHESVVCRSPASCSRAVS